MTGVRADDAVRGLLGLLADGAGRERLAKVAAAARAEGVRGEELAAIERATEDALRVRATVAAHQRRETELAALFDTASDLAQLRDTDAVLRSIVHRARMLLGVDVSYLSMNDERSGITYMRVTDGSASALFQQVTLGMGEGLGGLVAQSARPYATRDYFADERFLHTSPIDSSVKDEGLRAILGVPLALGSKVIGVLYAADRTPRDFAAEEVALLSSLADHAAIAIDNAHLLDETRQALADLNQAHKTISAHNAAMRRAEEAHDRLMDLVLRGGDLPSVAAAVADVLRGGIAVHDAAGVELARVGEAAAPTAEAVAASRGTGRAVSTGETWVCAVLAGPEPLGSLVLTGRPTLDDADRRLFERAGVVTALLLMLRRSVAHAEDEVRGELLTDLLTAPDRNPAALLDRGRRVGVDLTARFAVLVATADRVPRRRLALAAARYGALAGVHAEQVVLLAREERPGALAARMARELNAALDAQVTVGAAGPARGPAALADAHAEAARCVRSLLALGRAGEGGSSADLGFVGLLLGDRADLDTYVRDTLGPVLDYDERRGTDLLRTLEAYFSCGTNLTRAKEVLHVHVNTVVQRLERIAALLGADWQEPGRALEIHLALRVHRLARERPSA
ncbi:helix-turn-helix domain-containing protein [Actinokineospora sp. 24-640]